MIPRIIHFCWLSGDPYPPLIQRCIESWHSILPNYEFRLWDTVRFDVNSCRWTSEAYRCRKYAFAADYIRLYALYTEGGIYLDADVLMYKSFDDLLQLPFFLGEDRVHYFEPAIIGAEAGTPWLKDILDYYETRPFILSDGTYDTKELPKIFFERLSTDYKFAKIEKYLDVNSRFTSSFIDRRILPVFSYRFFNSRNFVQTVRYSESYCSHCFAGSWYQKKKKIYQLLLPSSTINLAHLVYYHLYNHFRIRQYQVPYYPE